jgi:DNA-binding transcriptional regulator YbjK
MSGKTLNHLDYRNQLDKVLERSLVYYNNIQVHIYYRLMIQASSKRLTGMLEVIMLDYNKNFQPDKLYILSDRWLNNSQMDKIPEVRKSMNSSCQQDIAHMLSVPQ